MPITVHVVYSPRARDVRQWSCAMPSEATVGDVLRHIGFANNLSARDMATLECGVWGRRAELDQLVRADDRVEVYRPLLVDPKVARRERFVRQGAKSAGLFSKRRTGAKAGY